MPGKQLSHFALQLLVIGVCAGSGVPLTAQEHEEDYPDANFLEYLASLEEVDGEWLGPEQMQYLHKGVPVPPEPAQLSSEQEEKK